MRCTAFNRGWMLPACRAASGRPRRWSGDAGGRTGRSRSGFHGVAKTDSFPATLVTGTRCRASAGCRVPAGRPSGRCGSLVTIWCWTRSTTSVLASAALPGQREYRDRRLFGWRTARMRRCPSRTLTTPSSPGTMVIGGRFMVLGDAVEDRLDYSLATQERRRIVSEQDLASNAHLQVRCGSLLFPLASCCQCRGSKCLQKSYGDILSLHILLTLCLGRFFSLV